MRINRFPKMAALQYKRALKLGFDEPHAKAIGIAEATKYAIFKNLSHKKRIAHEKEAIANKGKKEISLDDKKYEIFKLQALDGWPFVGDRIYTDKDYDRYFLKWGDDIKLKIEKWALDIVDKCDEKILKNENKFFNECWKVHRDELKEL